MILIVGGAGYIGSHTNKFLHESGFETIVFDNLSTGHLNSVQWGTFIKGDLGNIKDIRSVFELHNITAVFHFAAHAYVGESVIHPEKYYYNNVSNTLNLLKVMKEFEVRSLIFSSSCATYGSPITIPINENHPEKPINPYGKTKLIVDNILMDYSNAYDFQYVSLRYFNAAGNDPTLLIGESHNPETHLIPLVIESAIDPTKIINIFGNDYDTPDGTCIRDYIHVNDLADAHVQAYSYLQKDNSTSQIINLGTGESNSVKEIIISVEKKTGLVVNSKISKRREGDPAILIADNKKAKKLLCWSPKYNLNDIISHTVDWQKNKKY
ncbi:MAG: UDP-glucose 4-epimerase GalE [Bacteroidetes bacterium]|nr:UDP-glucose 4-epimerase GalE [Bacteroidota bacterium]